MKYIYNVYCNNCGMFVAGFNFPKDVRDFLKVASSQHSLIVYVSPTHSYFEGP